MTPSLDIPSRFLLGPGPSNVDPRVLAALTQPVVGHLDPAFLRVMDESAAMLRRVYRTKNDLTLALPGTGTSGMEAGIANLIEKGDRVIVCVAGYFGERVCEMVQRHGGELVRVEAEWGKPIRAEQVQEALREHAPVRLVAIVHAETSTGVQQPLAEIAALVQESGALLMVDAVTSLGGVDLPTDALQTDYVYSCSQKCLGCPPGLSPITVSDQARERIALRKRPPASWYLDLELLQAYWDERRAYHHTAPVTLHYALHEGLRLALDEGLEARFERHAAAGAALQIGLQQMGLKLLADLPHRLPVLTTVRVPDGVSDAAVRAQLLTERGIEIGGGLGPLRGQIWRIGTMGVNASPQAVLLALSAIGDVLAAHGHRTDVAAGLAAAREELAVRPAARRKSATPS